MCFGLFLPLFVVRGWNTREYARPRFVVSVQYCVSVQPCRQRVAALEIPTVFNNYISKGSDCTQCDEGSPVTSFASKLNPVYYCIHPLDLSRARRRSARGPPGATPPAFAAPRGASAVAAEVLRHQRSRPVGNEIAAIP